MCTSVRGLEEVEEELMLINSFGHWGPVRLIKEAAVMCFAPHFLSPPSPVVFEIKTVLVVAVCYGI